MITVLYITHGRPRGITKWSQDHKSAHVARLCQRETVHCYFPGLCGVNLQTTFYLLDARAKLPEHLEPGYLFR